MIGKRFAHYEVVEKLGSGGMGEVYRARDLSLGREVAVKFLPARFAADPKRLIRFEQEARAASSLAHPNIITIHEIGQAEGLPYIVMELVRGRTLREMLRGKPLLTRRALELAAQAAEGLAKAHAAGIVHRDLKPENIMISDDGFVKILDFGLAKLVAHPSDSGSSGTGDSEADTQSFAFGQILREDPGARPDTAAGAVLGTVSYMSPEQARGHAVDFRADQFSCGAILYEMATGRRAFERASAVQTLAAIIEDQPEPILSLNPDVPAPFRWIAERCLAKDPADRYASTLDLARELRNVSDRLDEVSGAPSSPVTLPPARRRLRRSIAAAGVLALILGALALGPARGRLLTWLQLAPVPAQKQLAVLTFANPGGDTGSFCDGLVETLTSKLTQLEQFQGSLWVIPASEVRQAAVASAAAARRVFGVNLVVTGSVQKVGDRLRLTANLVDAVNLRQLRSVSLDSPAADLSVWQDGVVDRIVDMLELEVGPEARQVLRAGGTRVPGAYELYVKGRGELQRFESPERLARAIALFQQALQQDPGYALAYAGIGEAQWRRYDLSKDMTSVELAQKACRRAVELNDLLAPVHVTLGMIHAGTGRYEEAALDFGRALALDPASAEAEVELGWSHDALGRLDEAESAFRRAIELRPDYWAVHNSLGAFFYSHGRYPEAEQAFRRVVELTPDNVRGYDNLGGLLHLMGRSAEALALLARSVAIKPTPVAFSNLATVQFFLGRYSDAARGLERAVKLNPGDSTLWYNLGAAYYWAPGERGRAKDAYDRAAELAEKERALNPRDARVLARLADCHAMLGHAAQARALALEALKLAPLDVNVMFVAGSLYEHLGNRERALESISRALASGYSRAEVEHAPGLERLRADPRFERLAPRPPDAKGTKEGE